MFGLLKSYEVELSPDVKGRITNEGKALSGVEVTRKLYYKGYEKSPITDFALTNTRGEFSFDEVVVESKAPGNMIGQDYLVTQEITIKKGLKDPSDETDDYWLWAMSKSWKSVPPVNKLLLNLNADLQNEETQYDLDISQYGGPRHEPVVSICDLDENIVSSLLSLD